MTSDIKDYDMGLYDNRAKGQSSVKPYKIVQASKFFPAKPDAVIAYAVVTRGTIAQINWGSPIHYHINEYGLNDLAKEIHLRVILNDEEKAKELAKFILDNQ